MKRSLISLVLAAGILLCGCEISDDIRIYTPEDTVSVSAGTENGAQLSDDDDTADENIPETVGGITEQTEEAVPAADMSAEEFTESEDITFSEEQSTQKERKIYGTVQEYLDNMTVEEKLGQVILARFPSDPAGQAFEYDFGGYTLYAADIENETPASLTEKLGEINNNSAVPMFFAADEEGGNIVRVSRYAAFAERPLPSVQEMLSSGGDIEAWADELAEGLNNAGINLDLAPVADVAESKSDYIYDRTCGLDYEGTAETIGGIVSALNARNIVSCLKHFPGYGPNVDTHTGIAVDTRSRENFESKDILPFIGGIEAGSPMIMVNHNIVEAYNADVPASLAPEVHNMLRGLGFDGIIITDDLGMDAITLYTDDPYADAFIAGNDMLCVSDGKACYDSLYAAFESGRISEERLDESVARIISVKLRYGVIS